MSNRMAPFSQIAETQIPGGRCRNQHRHPSPLRVGHRVVQPLPRPLAQPRIVQGDESEPRASAQLRRNDAVQLERARPSGAFVEERRAGGNERSADMAQREKPPVGPQNRPTPDESITEPSSCLCDQGEHSYRERLLPHRSDRCKLPAFF